MSGQAFHDTRCGGLWINTPDRQTVEADHGAIAAAHIGLRTVGLLVEQGVALQKLIQLRLTAIKLFDGIGRLKFADGLKTRSAQPNTPGSESNFFKRGFACTGRSSACWNASHCASVRVK